MRPELAVSQSGPISLESPRMATHFAMSSQADIHQDLLLDGRKPFFYNPKASPTPHKMQRTLESSAHLAHVVGSESVFLSVEPSCHPYHSFFFAIAPV